MGKYFDKKSYVAMVKAESARRSSETFFSSKEGENYFGSVAGQPLKVVGISPVPANGDINAFNVVKFNDGHQMSTSRFFSAKGLRWPVGGNVSKLNYLLSALENNIEIEVTPEKVTVTKMLRRDGTYVGPKNSVLQPVDIKDEKGKVTGKGAPSEALDAVTYYFEEQNLPSIEMIDFNEEEQLLLFFL